MRTSIAWRDWLQDEDIVWLFQAGRERTVQRGAAIVHEGIRPSAIFLVIRGGFDVDVDSVGDEPLARLETGELIGEISFLEGSAASATIVAAEDSAVLEIDNRVLSARIGEDSAFAARMYRAFALVAERRLRKRVDHLAHLFEAGEVAGARCSTSAFGLD